MAVLHSQCPGNSFRASLGAAGSHKVALLAMLCHASGPGCCLRGLHAPADMLTRSVLMWSALLQRAALAHLVAGFVERQPLLVQTALQLFDTVKKVCPSAAYGSRKCSTK